MSHDPAKWRELLAGFREGYARYGSSMCFLGAATGQELEDHRAKGEHCHHLGFVPLSAGCDGPSEGYVICVPRFDPLGRPLLEVHEAFCTLATKAGAWLPQEIKGVIAKRIGGGCADALSWWLTLLWQCIPPTDDDLSPPDGEKKKGRVVFVSPFEDSACAVEACSLTSETPILRTIENEGKESLRPGGEEPTLGTGSKREADKPGRLKRSTESGEARSKIIAALAAHHRYDNGSCLNLAPIGVNELAKKIGVSKSTVSVFFDGKFKGHSKYRNQHCRDAGYLASSLKLLMGDFPPSMLFDRIEPQVDPTDVED